MHVKDSAFPAEIRPIGSSIHFSSLKKKEGGREGRVQLPTKQFRGSFGPRAGHVCACLCACARPLSRP